jgi:hypothetical protein
MVEMVLDDRRGTARMPSLPTTLVVREREAPRPVTRAGARAAA